MKIFFIFIATIGLLLSANLNVQAATNLKYVLEEIKSEFLKNYKSDHIEITFGASSQLYVKISQGLKTDIFISADIGFPQKLFEAKISSKPTIYARGILVLWSNTIKIKNLNHILNSKTIAVPNPKTAPYGRATEEALKNSQLYDEVRNRFVQGNSVAKTNQFVVSKAADMGFTALSTIKFENKANYILIDENLYSPIMQAMTIMNDSSNKELAKRFFDFILSNEGQEIFKKYGYKSK